MKIVINKCYGGFGLSAAAYERLAELGIPVRPYIREERDPATGRYKKEPRNAGRIIFDRTLTPEDVFSSEEYIRFMGRYWDTWTNSSRTDALVIQVVEELGEKANDRWAQLQIVEIPDDVDWEIDEYDGMETVREKSRSWG